MENIKLDKKETRKLVRQIRKDIPNDEKIKQENLFIENIYNNILKKYPNKKNIFIYLSYGDELGTHKLIEKLMSDGYNITVPVSLPKKQMLASKLNDLNDMGYDKYGILTVKEEKILEVNPKNIDIAIVPAVAFNIFKERIGNGYGYYDIFLGKHENILKVGVVFDEQLLNNRFNVDDYDINMDYIVTAKKFV